MKKLNLFILFSVAVAVCSAQSIKSLSNGIQVKNGADTVWGLTNTGFYTPDGRNVTLKQLGVTLESVTKTIYVSSYTGDDSNGGTSWGDAFATFDKAIDTIGNLLDVTVTVQIDSGTYYASKESIRAIEEMKANANVDILSKGMTDTITTLTSVTQDNDTLFKYYTLTDLSTFDLDSAYVEGTFRLPIHSNGNDYVILATAESGGVGSVVTKNKTILKFDDSDHIVLNYLSEYSRGGITFQNLKPMPLGNKALRMAAFGTSKLKFDGCDIQALNIQNNNIIINQCHLYTTQRGIVLNNYNSFIEQSVIYGPGKSSGNSCFDIQNGNVVIDNLIIDGFGQVFENSQGIANIGFYDNSSDMYITNCEKVFSANDGFYVGSGDLNSLLIDNVDYLYNIISDKNVGIILDTSMLIGTPLISYVENDNGIRIKPEKNYIAYVAGVHDTNDFTVPTFSNLADTIRTGYIKNIGDNDLVIGRKYPTGGIEWGTGLDADFDIKQYYDNDYNESFGFGFSKSGTSSIANLHTNNGMFYIYRTSMKWFDNASIQYAYLDTNGFSINGHILSDSANIKDISNDTITVNKKATFNGEIEINWHEETYSSIMNIDFTNGNEINRYTTLTGNVTINITALPYGTSTLAIKQDATGGHVVNVGTGWGEKRNTFTFDTGTNGVSIIQFMKTPFGTIYWIDKNQN